MKIGVTGGAGYIGSHIVRDLLEAGHEVCVLDDMGLGNPANVWEGLLGYRFIRGSIADRGGSADHSPLSRFLEFAPEVVFHFAAFKAAGESMTHPLKYSANNLRGSFYLFERLIEAGCKRLVFSSTAAVYGNPAYTPVDEAHPLRPINYYGYSKLSIEENLDWLDRLCGFKSIRLRYFNAAGYDTQGRVRGLEKSPNNLFPVLMEVATGKRKQVEIFGTDYPTRDGTCIRDYIHVNDLSRAHLLAMDYLLSEQKSEVFNLGSEKGITVYEVLDAVRSATGREIPHKDGPRREGDPAALIASAKKAKEMLAWQAEYSDAKTIAQSMWQVYKDAF